MLHTFSSGTFGSSFVSLLGRYQIFRDYQTTTIRTDMCGAVSNWRELCWRQGPGSAYKQPQWNSGNKAHQPPDPFGGRRRGMAQLTRQGSVCAIMPGPYLLAADRVEAHSPGNQDLLTRTRMRALVRHVDNACRVKTSSTMIHSCGDPAPLVSLPDDGPCPIIHLDRVHRAKRSETVRFLKACDPVTESGLPRKGEDAEPQLHRKGWPGHNVRRAEGRGNGWGSLFYVLGVL